MFENDKVGYSTPKHKFEEVVVDLFNKGVASTKKIPQLEKLVLTKLFWSGTPLLESVGENEPLVKRHRERIRKSMKQAIIPITAYAKEYEQYLELANLDINEYLE